MYVHIIARVFSGRLFEDVCFYPDLRTTHTSGHVFSGHLFQYAPFRTFLSAHIFQDAHTIMCTDTTSISGQTFQDTNSGRFARALISEHLSQDACVRTLISGRLLQDIAGHMFQDTRFRTFISGLPVSGRLHQEHVSGHLFQDNFVQDILHDVRLGP